MPWLPLKIPHPHSITLISKTSLSLYRQYMVFFSKKKSILRSCFHQEKQTKTIRWINCACTYYRIMSICALMYKHKQSWCSLLYWNVFIPCLLQSIRALLVCTWACVPGTPNRSHSRVCNTDLPLNVSLSALSANWKPLFFFAWTSLEK